MVDLQSMLHEAWKNVSNGTNLIALMSKALMNVSLFAMISSSISSSSISITELIDIGRFPLLGLNTS